MFKEIIFNATVPVKPEMLGEDKRKSLKESLKEIYEGKIVLKKYYFLKILEILDIGEGEIFEEDPNVYYPVKAKAIVFEPMLHEVVKGEIVDVTNFGIFIRFGPIDALAHISQITDEFLKYNKKTSTLVTEDNKKIIKIGDSAIARIIGISLDKGDKNKILLTLKQPGLGIVSWIKREKEKKAKDNK